MDHAHTSALLRASAPGSILALTREQALAMLSLPAVHALYNYNYWARDRQLEACARLTEEQFVRPLGGSFPSVRDTLAHLVDNEAYYLHRWRGHGREQIVAAMGSSQSAGRAASWPAKFPTLSHIENRWREVEHAVRAYLLTLTESDLSSEVTYVDSSGRPWTYPRWCLLLHVANHQTYHRGQIALLLRQLGATAPATDFLLGFHTGFVAG